jgi:integrase
MRKTEILTVRLEHIDLQRRIIFIPKAKSGAREQPVTAHLAEFLLLIILDLFQKIPLAFPFT